jgi:hypothetical protein
LSDREIGDRDDALQPRQGVGCQSRDEVALARCR